MIRSHFLRSKLILFLVWFCINQSFSQCLEEGPVLIPESSISKNNSYSRIMAGHGDYLAISAANNDSLEFDGGLVYLYKMISDRWEKVAELTASEYNLQMYFGRSIAITDNLIVIAGNTFTDEGYHYDELFVYTKEEMEEWSTRSESYRIILRDDLVNTGMIIDEMVIKNNFLGVSYYTSTDSFIAFYQINPDNSLTYLNTIEAPRGSYNNTGSYGRDFDFSSSIVAVGQKEELLIYNFDDAINTTNPVPTARLIPEIIEQQDFANQVEVVDNTVFAVNGYSYQTGDFKTSVYIFEEPPSGWVGEINESATLSLLNTDWFGFEHSLAVKDEYVFLCRQREHVVYGFKKKSVGWEDANPDFSISKTKEFEEDLRVFGNEFVLFDDYFVSGYQGGEPASQEVAISYAAEGGMYENISSEHQQLSEIHYSASESDFGRSLSYSHNRLAVGANGDRVNGRNAGAVYIYNRNVTSEDYNLSEIIRAHDGNPYDNFGAAVEISDSLLFVSSLAYDSLDTDGSYIYSSIGKVYQYELEGGLWVYKNSINNPGNLEDKNSKNFGHSISYSDGYVAISQFYSGTSESHGKVYIFKQSENGEWINTAELYTSDQQKGDFFGRKVILKDSLLVVATGSPEYNSSHERKVYLFKRRGPNWESGTEDAYLIPGDKTLRDYFGFSIDMHRDMIVVGSPAYDYGDTKKFAGRAYLFKKPETGWKGRVEESLILEPNEPLEEDFFGYDVSIDQNQILIGAASSINNPSSIWSSADIDDLQPGKLYFFDPYLNDGVPLKHERYIQLSPNNRYLDGFGFQLEKSYDRVFVSAIYDNNESGFRSGGVYDLKYTTYIYGIEDPICAENGPFQMQSNILGGTWAGEGITDSATGMFDPNLVSEDGWTVITYTAGDCTVSTSVYVGTATELIDKSEASITKCKTEHADLFVEYTSNARTVWYYKKLPTDQFQQIESDLNSIEVSEAGYYFVTIDNGICDGLSAQFEVINEDVSATLNHNENLEVCSYEPQKLFLISTNEIENIEWYFSYTINGEYNIIGTRKEISPDKTGYYFASYETALCTYYTDTLSVNYIHQEIILNSPPPLCYGDKFQLIASPETGLWSGNGVSPIGLIETIGLDNRAYEATYSVIEGNCLFQETLSFDVIKLNNPFIESSGNEVCVNEPVTLFSADFDANAEITWFLNSKQNIFEKSTEATTDIPGTYFYKVNLNGCETTSDSIQITMKTDSLFVPNVVTRNNDGLNEDFRIYHKGTSKVKVNIYNRWGDLVYEEEGDQIIWQPKVPTGMYYWYVEYLNCYNQKESARGWVNVLGN